MLVGRERSVEEKIYNQGQGRLRFFFFFSPLLEETKKKSGSGFHERKEKDER